MDLKQTLKRPIITEKSLLLAAKGYFTFEVDRNATKPQISKAVEMFFGITPTTVKTLLSRGKTKRMPRTRKTFTTSDMKKAIVTLPKGKSIALFSEWFSLEDPEQSKPAKKETKKVDSKKKDTKKENKK